jgi:hypothetical protein
VQLPRIRSVRRAWASDLDAHARSDRVGVGVRPSGCRTSDRPHRREFTRDAAFDRVSGRRGCRHRHPASDGGIRTRVRIPPGEGGGRDRSRSNASRHGSRRGRRASKPARCGDRARHGGARAWRTRTDGVGRGGPIRRRATSTRDRGRQLGPRHGVERRRPARPRVGTCHSPRHGEVRSRPGAGGGRGRDDGGRERRDHVAVRAARRGCRGGARRARCDADAPPAAAGVATRARRPCPSRPRSDGARAGSASPRTPG